VCTGFNSAGRWHSWDSEAILYVACRDLSDDSRWAASALAFKASDVLAGPPLRSTDTPTRCSGKLHSASAH
jgi:hypothetical protein